MIPRNSCLSIALNNMPRQTYVDIRYLSSIQRFAQDDDDSTDVPSMCGDPAGLEELPSTSSSSTVSLPSDGSGVSSATSDRLTRLIAQLKLVPKSWESTSHVGSTTTNDIVDLVSESEDPPEPKAPRLSPSDRLRDFFKSRKAARIEKQAKSQSIPKKDEIATPESPDIPEYASRCWNPSICSQFCFLLCI